MSQRTEIYTLTGKKLGVITQGIPEAYMLSGKKLAFKQGIPEPYTHTGKKESVSENFSKKDTIKK